MLKTLCNLLGFTRSTNATSDQIKTVDLATVKG